MSKELEQIANEWWARHGGQGGGRAYPSEVAFRGPLPCGLPPCDGAYITSTDGVGVISLRWTTASATITWSSGNIYTTVSEERPYVATARALILASFPEAAIDFERIDHCHEVQRGSVLSDADLGRYLVGSTVTRWFGASCPPRATDGA